MKFYLVSHLGKDVDCCMSKADAINAAKNLNRIGVHVYEMDIPVNAESIRRILGDVGGYAKKVKTVYSIH
jgi:hypothetical protein